MAPGRESSSAATCPSAANPGTPAARGRHGRPGRAARPGPRAQPTASRTTGKAASYPGPDRPSCKTGGHPAGHGRSPQPRRQFSAAACARCFTGQLPWRYTGARLPRRRLFVFSDRSAPYTALLTGCNARLARFTDFGVTARLTARPGCMARRTPRGMNSPERNPTAAAYLRAVAGHGYLEIPASPGQTPRPIPGAELAAKPEPTSPRPDGKPPQ